MRWSPRRRWCDGTATGGSGWPRCWGRTEASVSVPTGRGMSRVRYDPGGEGHAGRGSPPSCCVRNICSTEICRAGI
jgi:hypothetical protein